MGRKRPIFSIFSTPFLTAVNAFVSVEEIEEYRCERLLIPSSGGPLLDEPHRPSEKPDTASLLSDSAIQRVLLNSAVLAELKSLSESNVKQVKQIEEKRSRISELMADINEMRSKVFDLLESEWTVRGKARKTEQETSTERVLQKEKRALEEAKERFSYEKEQRSRLFEELYSDPATNRTALLENEVQWLRKELEELAETKLSLLEATGAESQLRSFGEDGNSGNGESGERGVVTAAASAEPSAQLINDGGPKEDGGAASGELRKEDLDEMGSDGKKKEEEEEERPQPPPPKKETEEKTEQRANDRSGAANGSEPIGSLTLKRLQLLSANESKVRDRLSELFEGYAMKTKDGAPPVLTRQRFLQFCYDAQLMKNEGETLLDLDRVYDSVVEKEVFMSRAAFEKAMAIVAEDSEATHRGTSDGSVSPVERRATPVQMMEQVLHRAQFRLLATKSSVRKPSDALFSPVIMEVFAKHEGTLKGLFLAYAESSGAALQCLLRAEMPRAGATVRVGRDRMWTADTFFDFCYDLNIFPGIFSKPALSLVFHQSASGLNVTDGNRLLTFSDFVLALARYVDTTSLSLSSRSGFSVALSPHRGPSFSISPSIHQGRS